MNSAPASNAARQLSGSRIVPAPSSTLSPYRSATRSMTRIAFGTVMVISATPMPPLMMASAARNASSGEGARTMGTSPTSRIRPIAFSLDQAIAFHSGLIE